MFDTPAYASYIQLCRELNLTKERAEPGDIALIWLHHDDPPWVSAGGAWYSEKGFSSHGGHWHRDVLGKQGDGGIWLPRLDQWLTMLEEAGVLNVRFVFPNETSLGNRLVRDGDCLAPRMNPGATAATNEEIAARLWMAVTGRTAG